MSEFDNPIFNPCLRRPADGQMATDNQRQRLDQNQGPEYWNRVLMANRSVSPARVDLAPKPKVSLIDTTGPYAPHKYLPPHLREKGIFVESPQKTSFYEEQTQRAQKWARLLVTTNLITLFSIGVYYVCIKTQFIDRCAEFIEKAQTIKQTMMKKELQEEKEDRVQALKEVHEQQIIHPIAVPNVIIPASIVPTCTDDSLLKEYVLSSRKQDGSDCEALRQSSKVKREPEEYIAPSAESMGSWVEGIWYPVGMAPCVPSDPYQGQ